MIKSLTYGLILVDFGGFFDGTKMKEVTKDMSA